MDATAARRADIDAKQAAVARVLEAMEVEAVVMVMPVHVAWFTSGLNVRGLFADSERPCVFTNGRQRWLICSNTDTQRFFDEELDQLGFQLREWQWETGRAEVLAHATLGRKVAADRPFPNIPMANDHLRPLVRVLRPFEQEQYREVGRLVAHAVEATARTCRRGETEEEIAGQLGHRLLHRGVEPAAVSVVADDRGAKYRRSGFGTTPATRTALIQATGHRAGLYATCSRTVCFGEVAPEFRMANDLAMRQAALFRSVTQPEAEVAAIGQIGRQLLANTPFEFDWRLAPPGYGAGRFPAEELRRAGAEEPLAAGQAVVWQPRVGPAAVVDTLIVTDGDPVVVTPTEEWPLRRFALRGGPEVDVPDVYVRDG